VQVSPENENLISWSPNKRGRGLENFSNKNMLGDNDLGPKKCVGDEIVIVICSQWHLPLGIFIVFQAVWQDVTLYVIVVYQ